MTRNIKNTVTGKKPKVERGATTLTINSQTLILEWLRHHYISACESLRLQIHAPAQHFLTAAVIGITLTLPTIFMLSINNLQQLGAHWNGHASLSVFLERDSDKKTIDTLQQQLQKNPAVVSVSLITAEQGLAQFERSTGITNTLVLLDKNPLPPLLVVELTSDTQPDSVEILQTQWQHLPHVDSVQTDFVWLKKLFYIVKLGKHIAWGLAALLGSGALLSIGNAIRLVLENRRADIVVAKLVGATDGFVRRPFLYSGFWFGLSGGMVAVVLVTASYYSMIAPVSALAALYQTDFVLHGPTFFTLSGLLFSGIAIGVVGAWLTVWRHLRNTLPQ